jgi:hypothetical protein
MLNCPYSKLELMTSVMGISEEESKQIEEKMEKDFESFAKELESQNDMAVRHTKCAEFHGITREEYFNSPNMETLMKMYSENLINMLIQKLQECGMTDRQAWYVVLKGLGEDV